MTPAEYLNQSVWVRLAPSIHGVGVFAIRDIPKGTKITDNDRVSSGYDDYGAERRFFNYTDKLLEQLHPAIVKMIHDRFILYPGHNLWPSPNFLQFYREYMNYSDLPSVSQKMISLRKIHEGEELLQRYPMDGARASSILHHRYIIRGFRRDRRR